MAPAGRTGALLCAAHDDTVYPLAYTMAGFAMALFVIVFVGIAGLGANAARRKAQFPEGEDAAL